MAGDFLPGSDIEMQKWAGIFSTYLTANAVALGLMAADATNITTLKTAFDTTMTSNNTAQQTAQSTRQAKDTARTTFDAAIRTVVRRIQANPAVSDAQKAALGITVKDKTPTASANSAAATSGASRPIGIVDTSQRLRHEIRFMDEKTPTSRAKPANAMGCEIWVKITDQGAAAPKGIEECTFVALDTATPYVTEYEGAQAGKMAHYLLRWSYKGGEKGPISEVVSATIVG